MVRLALIVPSVGRGRAPIAPSNNLATDDSRSGENDEVDNCQSPAAKQQAEQGAGAAPRELHNEKLPERPIKDLPRSLSTLLLVPACCSLVSVPTSRHGSSFQTDGPMMVRAPFLWEPSDDPVIRSSDALWVSAFRRWGHGRDHLWNAAT